MHTFVKHISGKYLIELPEQLVRSMHITAGDRLYIWEVTADGMKRIVVTSSPVHPEAPSMSDACHENHYQVQQLENLALTIFSSREMADRWLSKPKGYLNGLSPLEAARGGRMDEVMERLSQLKSGYF